MEKFPISIEKRNERSQDFISNIAIIVLAAVLILSLSFNILYSKIYVVGSSMQRTLTGAPSKQSSGGDYVYICKYIKPDYGDIVVVDVGNNYNIIKRVIAFGGDKVEMVHGELYVNDNLVEEPYVSPDNNTDIEKNTFAALVVDEGCVFCMGDNRDVSKDSRPSKYSSDSFGCLPVENISGVVTGWSMQFKEAVTSWHTFFDFTLPDAFGA